jgi:hypothetical protein
VHCFCGLIIKLFAGFALRFLHFVDSKVHAFCNYVHCAGYVLTAEIPIHFVDLKVHAFWTEIIKLCAGYVLRFLHFVDLKVYAFCAEITKLCAGYVLSAAAVQKIVEVGLAAESVAPPCHLPHPHGQEIQV